MVPELEIPTSEASLPKKGYLNPLGPAVVLERIHTGAVFEVFRVRVATREQLLAALMPLVET